MASVNKRYALFTNGCSLSRFTLQALMDAGRPPDLIVLPEYPPAGVNTHNDFSLTTRHSRNPLLETVSDSPVAYAPKARQRDIGETLQQYKIDVMLVACWPYLIDAGIVDVVAGAALNLHPSLLPAYRGPNPIDEQLVSGDRKFGVSLHRLSNAFDRGDLVAQAEINLAKKSPDREMVEQDCAKGGVQLFVNLLDKNPASWPCWPQGANRTRY